MICVSCNNEHNDKYCPNCGEKNGIKKITLASIIEDAFSSVTNMDRGFLYNIKALILKPQKLITDYILGKRRGILNPISFLIFSVTIYLIVISVFETPKELNEINSNTKSSLEKVTNEVGTFIRTNIKYFWILSIIPLGLSLKLAFNKYNYLEHLAISSFVIGQATLAAVISHLLFKIPLIFDPIVYLSILWLIYKIFKNKRNKTESFLISFAILFVFVVQLSLIIGMMVIIKSQNIFPDII